MEKRSRNTLIMMMMMMMMMFEVKDILSEVRDCFLSSVSCKKYLQTNQFLKSKLTHSPFNPHKNRFWSLKCLPGS